MDRQKMFDAAAKGMLAQGRRCSLDGKCQYELVIDGVTLHCAVGFLIPEGHKAMNSDADVCNLLLDYPDLVELWGVEVDEVDSTEDQIFLDDLQDVHDMSRPEVWPRDLRKFALDHNLSAEGLPDAN